MCIQFHPIGRIHTPFQKREGMPIQSKAASGVRGKIFLKKEYAEGLADLDGFSHIILLYHFHQSKEFRLKIVPFLDDVKRGLFATRAPNRPNAIGLSVVKLISVKENVLEIENVDMLDGTPLLDIKPYVKDFDEYSQIRSGWVEKRKKEIEQTKSDKRFCL
jgi:tRNA-Thr(GGU) m(6)t(6)A37 methyltransferase TsaA